MPELDGVVELAGVVLAAGLELLGLGAAGGPAACGGWVTVAAVGAPDGTSSSTSGDASDWPVGLMSPPARIPIARPATTTALNAPVSFRRLCGRALKTGPFAGWAIAWRTPPMAEDTACPQFKQYR